MSFAKYLNNLSISSHGEGAGESTAGDHCQGKDGGAGAGAGLSGAHRYGGAAEGHEREEESPEPAETAYFH